MRACQFQEQRGQMPGPMPALLSPQKLNHRIEVPRSVPSLVTDRLLVMNFLEGVPITRLERHTQK